jgi:hypothetical protein
MKASVLVALFFILVIEYSHAQVYGCTDPLANNYNATATDNDGSCTYSSSSASPSSSTNLAAGLAESSGLISWNGQLWTHNDNADVNLYALDSLDGTILQTYPLTGTVNYDWEEISQDSSYVYVGDFGNNVNGNRTDLKIFRIEKSSLLNQSPVVDTIFFTYADQVDFTPAGSNNTDYDCEAFVVTADSIYLFTKQWVSNETALYSIPKLPGTYSAVLKTTYNVQGLITGATMFPDKRIVGLSGYTNLLQPFTWLLYDFNSADFFSGNKRRIAIPLPFHQVEGIATGNGLKWYMTNEYFSVITTPQKFHVFDFSGYLSNYLDNLTVGISPAANWNDMKFYSGPSHDAFTVAGGKLPASYTLYNMTGQAMRTGMLTTEPTTIRIDDLPAGMYFFRAGEGGEHSYKVTRQ